eukprot:4577228-Alexandrium_andersonii.AAC.1
MAAARDGSASAKRASEAASRAANHRALASGSVLGGGPKGSGDRYLAEGLAGVNTKAADKGKWTSKPASGETHTLSHIGARAREQRR